MRSSAFIPVFVLAMMLSLYSVAAEVKLPEPKKTGGTPVFEALEKRHSPGQKNFPSVEPSREELSTILWAASGHNRGNSSNKWTVPMAMGRPPYCKIYVVSKDGVHQYDWKNHSLLEIGTKDIRSELPLQQFAKDAPLALYFVVDGKEIEGLSEPLKSEGGPLLAGAMSQNVYLACEGLGVEARLVYSVKRDDAAKHLKVGGGDKVLFAMFMGKASR